MHNPNAKEISLAANHCKITEISVVLILSPPKPKIVRPINITKTDLVEQPIANINCPKRIEKPKTRNIILYPYLNISTPPNKGRITFGSEYKEYIKLYVYSKSNVEFFPNRFFSKL